MHARGQTLRCETKKNPNQSQPHPLCPPLPQKVSTHLIITSDEHRSHPLCCMIAVRSLPHSPLYTTRETHLSNAEWNCIWCSDLCNGTRVSGKAVSGQVEKSGKKAETWQTHRSNPLSSMIFSRVRSVRRLTHPSNLSLGCFFPSVSHTLDTRTTSLSVAMLDRVVACRFASDACFRLTTCSPYASKTHAANLEAMLRLPDMRHKCVCVCISFPLSLSFFLLVSSD